MPNKASKKKTAPKASGASGALSAKELLKIWSDMARIRRFEERCGQIYAMGQIGGFCHLYIGQEAVAVGLQAAIEKTDQVITGYRDHAHMLACGMDARRIMAELTGRADGYSKGKGGSMHMFAVAENFYGGHGIVGAQVPLGTGLAFANKYRKNNAITVVYFGDGAANQGQVYESFNMAKLWQLPCLYIIENNRYAMGTSVDRASSQPDLSQRGLSFAIPGEQVDGMDVEAVHGAACRAADYVRGGKGPYILEMLTYRYRGHSMSDPAKYRKREEVEKVRRETDPIKLLQGRLIERKLIAEDELKTQLDAIKEEIEAAIDFALESPHPSPSELHTDILAEVMPDGH